jgi:hypothetical protein
MNETRDVMRIVYPDWHEQPRKARIIRFKTTQLWAVFVPTAPGRGPHVQTFDLWDDALKYALQWCDEHEFAETRRIDPPRTVAA